MAAYPGSYLTGNFTGGNLMGYNPQAEQLAAQKEQQRLALAAQKDLLGQQLGADQQKAAFGAMAQQAEGDRGRAFEGQQADANRNMQLQLGLAGTNLKRDMFNQISPLITGMLGGGSQAGPPVSVATPQVTQGGIWSPGQVDQQVNAATAGNARTAATQSKAAQTQTAAQGFGSNSPLLAALQGQIGGNQMAQDATARREIPFQAAEGNAKMLLGQQQAAGTLANDARSVEAQQMAAQRSYMSSLAGVLAGMI